MARRLRTLFAGIPAHIVQRGNDRRACFFADYDRHYYLDQLEELATDLACQVHAYVLMDNHVHLLITPARDDSISVLMKNLGQRYVQQVNRIHGRTGAMWEGRFFSAVVDSGAYLFTCHRYIEMNPVRAGMVARPADYRWSSFRANAGREPSRLIAPHRDYVDLGPTSGDRAAVYRKLFDLVLDTDAFLAIRQMTRGGFAFGSEAFCKELAARCGRPMTPRRQPREPA